MQEALDTGDTIAQRAAERIGAEEHGVQSDSAARARTQAALVRESLVRCPGADELRTD